MKQLLIISIIAGMFLSIEMPAFAYLKPVANIIAKPNDGGYKSIATMKLKEYQKLVGRKLTIKEKVGFFVLKQKMKHQQDGEDKQGLIALILGLVGLGLFVIGIFVPILLIGSLVAAILAIVTGSTATKKNADNRKAKAGKLLGWIILGIMLSFLLSAAIAAALW